MEKKLTKVSDSPSPEYQNCGESNSGIENQTELIGANKPGCGDYNACVNMKLSKSLEDLRKRLSLTSKEIIVNSPVAKAILQHGVSQCNKGLSLRRVRSPELNEEMKFNSQNENESSRSKLSDLSNLRIPLDSLEVELIQSEVESQESPGSNGPQDVSIEPAGSVPFSFGLWSPGKTSPLRGRNMKEYEEQLEHLKKENFALKLRIYFLEERMGHKSAKEDKEELHKANIELKVETESLKKELGDKQELVRQAAALLTTLENQFKEQLQAAHEQHEKETDNLKATIASLQKNVDEYSERLRQEGLGDLTRLCSLAFSSVDEDGNDVGFGNPSRIHSEPIITPAKLQGVFSLQEEVGSPNGPRSPDAQKELIPSSAQKRIQELEDEVERLTTKVQDLQVTLQDKERTSQALEEDIVNLKKEIEEREDRMCDLEQEVTEKDQKVDQLMQELETRHLEIEAKDSTIQTLHEDLNKVEPQIEVKVQEIMEKDKIIEEKQEQLQQQNKILVEIQITLDEKEKQIAELEDSLSQATQKAEKLDKDFSVSLTTIQNMAQDVLMRDKEIAQLKKELKKKEKKVKDLLAELKEALDMLKKAKWEAEMSGGQDGVKEMVEEENERLWAELEQRKLELINSRTEKNSLLKNVEEKEEAMRKQREELEERIRALEKDRKEEETGERDKAQLDLDLATLKEKLESRDNLLKSQEAVVDALKSDLTKAKEELVLQKEELKDFKKDLSKNFNMQDFITKELFGRSKEVKELREKLSNLPQGQDNPLEVLKLILQANPVRFDPEGGPSKPPPQQIQVRSNSLSKLDSESAASGSQKQNGSSSQPSSRVGRSNSLSLLENALYAHMGQKVYNTNQTFNTYVLGGDAAAEKKATEILPQNDLAPVIPTGVLKMEVNSKEESGHAKTCLASILKETSNGESKHPLPAKMCSSHSQGDTEVEMCSAPQPVNLSESALQLLYQEVSTIRNEAQALRKDREILNQKVSALQMLNEQLSSSKVPDSDPCNQVGSEVNSTKREGENGKEEEPTRNEVHNSAVSDFKGQMDILKNDLKGIQRKVTLKMLEMASSRYQGSLKNYKQEIISLRKRLADSHNACDLLRNRLEELVDFMEQILDMDRKGIINLSYLSPAQRASLKKSLDDSRSLSHSLSHSLMIGTDSLLGDTLSTINDEEASRFCFSLDNLPLEINFSLFENVNTTDAGLNTSDLSVLDSSSGDLMYHSFAAKIVSQVESKTQEIDVVVAKLSHFISILEGKDEQIKLKMEAVVNLQNQNAKLEENVKLKDRLLAEAKGAPNVQGTTPQINGNSHSGLLLDDPNESNRSLHLSTLQHSLPSPTVDSRIYDGIFTTPIESSSSDTLPPPPSEHQYLEEERTSSISIERLPGLIDSLPKHFNTCQSDVGSACSTDFAVKGFSQLKESAFSKAATDAPQQSHAYGMSLEQLTLPPSFALASPSESEAWSEPDRNVSLARIGLETCNLISTGHDRSLSCSRMTRSAPFTSESEGEGIPEEVKEGSAGVGTPSSKPKRRSDAAEIKRLSAKLKTVEHLNETLRAELRIYQTLNHKLSGATEEKGSCLTSADASRQTSVEDRNVHDLLRETKEVSLENPGPVDGDDGSVVIPSSMLQEIRSLRMKLEEAIANNDLLRDQLEAALSGYLSEESRHLTAKLAGVQQELKLNQEKLLIAATAEEQLKYQIKENESKVFELGERLAAYMTCNQKLEKKINELNVELQGSRQRLANTEEELRASKEQKEWTEKGLRETKTLKLEMEIRSLQSKMTNMQQREKERERKIEEQQKYIAGLEEAKADYESKLSEQDSAITELCQSISKLQQESTKSSVSDEIISKLQEALQNSEGRLLQVTKERFVLVGEKALLQAQLASVTTHAKLLQREVRELSISDENSTSDSECKHVLHLQRLKTAEATILELQQDKELFQSEKQAMQKEMQLLQEEISALRAHLDHVLSREAVTTSREVRELASLQMIHKSLEEKHSSLERRYENLASEKSSLEEKLKEVHTREKDFEQMKETLKENELKREEFVSQLEAERCLSANLQIQIKHLQSNSSYHNVPFDFHTSGSPSATSDLIRPREEMSPLITVRGAVSPLKKSSSLSWNEDKENRFPLYSYSRVTHSLPLIDDDATSGDSPDLGIGSDGQFSSLERLGGSRGPPWGISNRDFASESKKEGRSARLCSETSHSQLLSELDRIRQEREELSTKLASTKESLKDALQQLSKANQKKESVERAIYRQLTKTHDVLRRAKGNLRQAKGRSDGQATSDQNPSTKETG